MNHNPTPIRFPHPDWTQATLKEFENVPNDEKWLQQDLCYPYMKELGFEPMFIVFEGTVKRASWWCKPDLTLADGILPDPQDQATISDFGIQACALLSCHADHFAPGPPVLPIMLDFEGEAWALPEANTRVTLLAKDIMHSRGSGRRRVGSYARPWRYDGPRDTNPMTPALEEYCRTADYVSYSPYNTPPYNLGGDWYDQVDMWTSYFDRVAAHLPRIALVCPTYVVEDRQMKDWSHLRNVPVPRALFKKQLTYLTDRRWELMAWMADVRFTLEVKALIQTMNEFQF
jgi:hypothetical protein